MECIILIRMDNGKIVAVMQGDGELAVFPDIEVAISAANQLPLLQAGRPYQIVECDEL